MDEDTIKKSYPCFGTPQYTGSSSICQRCRFGKRCWDIVKVRHALHKKYFDELSDEEIKEAKKKNNHKSKGRKK